MARKERSFRSSSFSLCIALPPLLGEVAFAIGKRRRGLPCRQEGAAALERCGGCRGQHRTRRDAPRGCPQRRTEMLLRRRERPPGRSAFTPRKTSTVFLSMGNLPTAKKRSVGDDAPYDSNEPPPSPCRGELRSPAVRGNIPNSSVIPTATATTIGRSCGVERIPRGVASPPSLCLLTGDTLHSLASSLGRYDIPFLASFVRSFPQGPQSRPHVLFRPPKNFLKKILKKDLQFVLTCAIITELSARQWYALLAQLDRASGYGPEGQGFESLRACQKPRN